LPGLSAGSLFRVEPLSTQNKRDFSCGIEPLDRYLHRQAGQDARKRIAAPFVMMEKGGADVIGYYTLSALSIDIGDWPPAVVHQLKLPRYPQMPVTLLGRLALDQRFRGRGVGGLLLTDALERSLRSTDLVASMAVVADAKDDAAVDFYQAMGILLFSDQSRHVFLPMSTIANLFADQG